MQSLDYRSIAFPTELCRLISRVGFKLLLILCSAICHTLLHNHAILASSTYHIIFIKKENIALKKLGELYAYIY